MKHLDRKASIGLLLEWSQEEKISLSQDQAGLLVDHLKWLLSANEQINLTAITDPIEALRLHVFDSIVASPEVGQAPGGAILDIGTGGGFPGVPLAVVCGRDAILLDSAGKKAAALSEFLETRLPGCSAVAQRSEEYASHPGVGFAVVVARAVGALPVLVELAAPLMMHGGRLVCLKGRPDDDEIRRGAAAGQLVGLDEISRRETALPIGGEGRTIIVYEKIAPSSVGLPRRPGRAQKKPLA